MDAFEFADGVTLTCEQLLAVYPIQLADSADIPQGARAVAVAGVGDITATGDNEVTAQQGAAHKLVTAAQGAEAVGAANVAPAANPAFHYDGLRTHDGTPVYMDENNMYYPSGNQPKTEGNLIAETYFPKRKAPEKPDYDYWFTCSRNVRPLVAQRAAAEAAHAIQVAQRANDVQGMGATMADNTHTPDQQKTAASTPDPLEKNPVTPPSKGLILSPWLMAKYVMDYHLQHSDAAALGGEIAEMHAAQSSGASLTPASGMLAAPHFDLHGKKTRH